MFTPASTVYASGDALSKLNPAQVRELREAFQVLDRDGDGLVGREDVVDMLNNLGVHVQQSHVQFIAPTDIIIKQRNRPGRLTAHHLDIFPTGQSAELDASSISDAIIHAAGKHVETGRALVGLCGL